jgi:hypothetical protein
MKVRYLTSWLLGGWIAGSLFMIMVATQNFRSVDRLLAAPAGAAAQIDKMGHDEARTFLRFQVSEQNRWYFETWEKVQLALGLALLILMLRQGKMLVILVGAMLVLLLAQRFYITPEIVRIGRLIDFAPQAAERKTFWMFHGVYSAVELTKLALGFFLSGSLVFGRSGSRIGGPLVNQLDVVDKSDYRHIDR